MADEQDYYMILEVAPDADDEALRMAYRRLAWRYHPDVAGPEGLERMREINVAYQTLADPEQRKIYDASIRPVSAAAPESPPARTRAERAGLQVGPRGYLSQRLRFTGLDVIPVAAVAFSADGGLGGLGQLDGRVTVVNTHDGAVAQVLGFGGAERAGALQGLRLSPRGLLAVAWGFSLGMRVWSVPDGRTLWNTATYAPSGAMDAILYDSQPHIRLATPDAPLALASDDAFRWTEDGRRATAIYSRPLTPSVSPTWLTPLRCMEDGNVGLLREPPDETWRVHRRFLSFDGRLLLTFSTGRVGGIGRANNLRLWELDRRNIFGAQEPRALGRVAEAAGLLQLPLAVSGDLRWVATGVAGRLLRLFDIRARRQRSIEVGILPAGTLIAISSDGSLVALARGERLQLFDATANSPVAVQEWTARSEITALAFSPYSGATVLGVGLKNGLAEIWASQ